MSGFPKDRGWNERRNKDRSMQVLVVAFAVTASIAVSVIVIAYATVGGGVLDGTGTTAKSRPGDKIEHVADTEKEVLETVYLDTTAYIDALLANIENEENISEQADDTPTAPEAAYEPPSERADEPADTLGSEPPAYTPVEEPGSEEPIAEESVSKPAQESIADEPTGDTAPTEEPTAEEPTDTSTTEPAEEPTSQPADEPTSDGTASDGTTTEEPTSDETTSEPEEETITETLLGTIDDVTSPLP